MTTFQPQPAGPAVRQFRWPTRRGRRRLAMAPPARRTHRLAFWSGSVMLAVSALWWGAALVARHAGLAVPWAVSPGVAHALLMTFGFLPLFIAGFC